MIIQGLGPQVSSLVASFGSCVPDRLPAALAACEQLRHAALECVDASVLDALVTLPSLSRVAIGKLNGSLTYPTPRPIQIWKQLELMECDSLMDLGRLPLGSTRRLVLGSGGRGGLNFSVPGLDCVGKVGLWQAMAEAVAALASVPELRWDGQLSIQVPGLAAPPAAGSASSTGGFPYDENANAVMAGALGVAASLHLHRSITALGPLSSKGVNSISLSLDSPYCQVSSSTVNTLGAAFGPAGLERLSLCFGCPTIPAASVAPSFWGALSSPVSLPHLHSLHLETQSNGLDQDGCMEQVSAHALQQLAGARIEAPLEVTLKAADSSHVRALKEIRSRVRATMQDGVPGARSLVALHAMYVTWFGEEAEVGPAGESDDEGDGEEVQGWAGCMWERFGQMGFSWSRPV